VERLRSLRECEREIDWWSHTLPPLRPRQQIETSQETEDPLLSCHQAEGGDLRDGGNGNRSVLWAEDEPAPSLPQLPSCPYTTDMGLWNVRANEDAGEGPSRALPRASQTAPCITTASAKKKRRVIVVDDSHLRGTDVPIYRPDLSHREVCCLPGARVRDGAGKIPGLVWPSDYYPLLIMQFGSDEVVERSPKVIERDFRALGQFVEGSGAQAVFSSILSVAGQNTERNRKTHLINMWLRGRCHWWVLGFF